jgi:sarcosine oxidase subunit gamma
MVEILAAPPARRLVLWGDAAVAERAGAAIGLSLPTAPGGAAEAGARAALWLGPGEWLLLAPEEDDLAPALSAALAGMAHALVDVSDGFAGIVLRGPGAARALSAGCPLDLEEGAFPPGRATRTVLGRVGITLWRHAAEEWRLEVGRSQAGYARDFLAEAARGMPGF